MNLKQMWQTPKIEMVSTELFSPPFLSIASLWSSFIIVSGLPNCDLATKGFLFLAIVAKFHY